MCAVHDVAEVVSPVSDDEDGNHKALQTGPKQPAIEPDDAYFSSLIALFFQVFIKCFPHYVHFFSAFIESILSEAFRQ